LKIKIDPADTLFSKLVRTWHPICESCHSRSSSQVHHFKSRKYQSVRFDPDNAWAVCFTCHRKFHEDPFWGIEQMKKKLGIRYDSFVLKANMILKRYDADKELLLLWIKQELKKAGVK